MTFKRLFKTSIALPILVGFAVSAPAKEMSVLNNKANTVPVKHVLVPSTMVTLEFPADKCLGGIRYNYGGQVHQIKAIGKVAVPARARVEFKVNHAGVDNLELLLKMPRGVITNVSLINLELSDKQFLKLKGLTDVELIESNDSDVSDVGLNALVDMKKLRSLWLGGAQITGRGLTKLKGLTALEDLTLSRNHLSDDGLASLSGLTHMTKLGLNATSITDKGLQHLQSLVELEKLEIDRNSGVTDAGIASLSEFKRLKKLSVASTKITAKGLESLRQLPDLREIRLSFFDCSKADIDHLRTVLPKCRLVDASSRSDLPADLFGPLH